MGRRVESVIFSYSELAQTHVNSYLFLLERRCLCLECFDFRFSLSAADIELSSSSSSSRGTGNRSRRILGNGFTSTVTGFFGISSKSGKLANSSALNSGCAGGWGELPPTVRMDGVLGLSCLLLCWNRLADVGLGGIVVATLARLLGDLFPCGCLEPIVFSTLLTGRTSLNDVIDDVILLFGERELACGSFGEARLFADKVEPPYRGRVLHTSRKTANKPLIVRIKYYEILIVCEVRMGYEINEHTFLL